jgi:hypothetical protein
MSFAALIKDYLLLSTKVILPLSLGFIFYSLIGILCGIFSKGRFGFRKNESLSVFLLLLPALGFALNAFESLICNSVLSSLLTTAETPRFATHDLECKRNLRLFSTTLPIIVYIVNSFWLLFSKRKFLNCSKWLGLARVFYILCFILIFIPCLLFIIALICFASS